MQTKLTLRMDEKLIAAAKDQARKNGKSLSQFVADYFGQFVPETDDPSELRLPPIVASLSGVLAAGRQDALSATKDSDKRGQMDEADYYRYLEDKYL